MKKQDFVAQNIKTIKRMLEENNIEYKIEDRMVVTNNFRLLLDQIGWTCISYI